MKALSLGIAVLLAGCAARSPEPDPPPALDEVRAHPSLGPDCVTSRGSPEACVVVTLHASELRTDDPAFCAHWFGYTADERVFSCLDANATAIDDEAARMTLWMTYPERDRSAIMTSLLYIVPGETRASVEWVAPQG